MKMVDDDLTPERRGREGLLDLLDNMFVGRLRDHRLRSSIATACNGAECEQNEKKWGLQWRSF
jgi:hypothetical protein